LASVSYRQVLPVIRDHHDGRLLAVTTVTSLHHTEQG
jgi:hypothetical protein